MKTRRIDRESHTRAPIVVVADDDLDSLQQIKEVLQGRFPRLHVLATSSVQPSVNLLLEMEPAVVVCGFEPDRVRGYDFLRRVSEMAPSAHTLLVTGKHWDPRLLDDLHLLACLRRPLEADTLVDLVAGLIYGDADLAVRAEAAV